MVAVGDPERDLRSWLELALAPKVSQAGKIALLREFGSPTAVLAQSEAALRNCHPEGARVRMVSVQERVDFVLAWIESSGGSCVLIGEQDYPARVFELLPAPPLVLFMRGDRELLETRALALVGGREPSPAGRARARAFALELAQEGFSIAAAISPGIAEAVFTGAQAAGRNSIAVIGTGSSWQHLRLVEEVAASGLLISEHAPGLSVAGGNYAERHRLLACLAQVLIVVEAPIGCDSLALADIAGDCGVEVLAVPSSPDHDAGRGCNRLLRDGAMLVEKSSEVIALLGDQAPVL